MKRILFLSLLLSTSVITNAQTNENKEWSRKYYRQDLNGSGVIKVLDEVGFKPRRTSDMRRFKTLILELSDRAYTQLNIDAWDFCSNKHDECFQIYNMYYKNVTKPYYDENCKALIVLMIIDGTLIDAKQN